MIIVVIDLLCTFGLQEKSGQVSEQMDLLMTDY